MNFLSKMIVCMAIFTMSIILYSESTYANTGCSKQDLRAIKRFDNRLRKAQKNITEGYAETRRKRNPDDIEDLIEDVDREAEIFDSAEYESMRPVYERCGRQIPKMHSGLEPFWVPTN